MSSSNAPDSSAQDRSGAKGVKALAALLVVAVAVAGFFLLQLRDDDQVDQTVANEAGVQPNSEAPHIPFDDVRAALGVDFVHVNGAVGDKLLPETGGSGCAWFDFDNDDDPDLLLLNGKPWPWDDETSPPKDGGITLFRNDGDAFVDATADVGLATDFYGQGAAIGDFDADGDDDLYLTSLGPSRMFRNDEGRFVDVTSEVNLTGNPDDWTTSAGFFDYDRDGDLDLFVCNYLRWTRDLDDAADYRLQGAGRSYAHPSNFPGTNNYLFRNDGGVFTDVSEEAGIQVLDEATGEPLGKALALTFVDVNRDGWLDVCVANDTVRHFLFRNNRDGTFEEMGRETGFALNAAGQTTSGMGVDAAAIDNAQSLAIAIGNFAAEMTSLYVANNSEEVLVDETVRLGIGGPTRDSLTFGLLFDDFDLDGRADLVHANGHLEETINAAQADQHYAQSAQLLWNAGAGRSPQFVELSKDAIGDLATPVVGRALGSADVDQDGDLDLVVTQVNGPPLLLRNQQSTGHHWLRCRLEGPAGNPHAIGAVLELEANGDSQRRVIMPTRSYLTQCEPIATFGLGNAETVDRLTVTWPDGSQQQVAVEAVDQVLTIRQETGSFYTLANRGKAELENSRFNESIELFQRAIAAEPTSLAMRRNLVRAYIMNGQQEDALAEIAEIESRSADESPGIAYMRGLAQLKLQQNDEAAQSFREAVRLDPNEATFHYQLAQALIALNQTEEARRQLERTAELDPLHSSAHYQLATFARQADEQEVAARHLRDHQRILGLKGQSSAAALEACRYTEPEPPRLPAAEGPTELPVEARFTVVEQATDLDADVASVAVISMDESGRYRLAAVADNGDLLILEFDEAGRPVETARLEGAASGIEGDVQLLVANALIDPVVEGVDEGDQPELAIVSSRQTRLVRYSPARETVEDLTESAGISSAAGNAARWIDADHDGDVDLCFATDDGLRIWRNNSDGTFVDATSEFGVNTQQAASDLDAADFDGANLGTEIVLAGASGPVFVKNELAGRLAVEDQASANLPAAQRIEVDDFDNDGLPDIAFVSPDAVSLHITGVAQPQRLPLSLDEIDATTTIDVDNDGWLDLVIAGRGGDQSKLILLLNARGAFVEQVAALATAEPSPVKELLDLDADGDCDTDLLLVHQTGALRTLRNDSDTANRQLKLSLHSFAGHPSSIGVRVQVRSEDFAATRWTDRELPIEIGTADRAVADSIQTLWGNGVYRNEIDVPVTCEPLPIIIIEFIRTDSCPFLYVHQEDQWRFVTDLLGTAPLNVVVARGVTMPPDPDEVFVLGPADELSDDESGVRIRITSELREVIYLDQVKVLTVDHPADTTVFSRDRVATSAIDGPQFLLGRDPIRVHSALGSDGVDRTAAVLEKDGVFAAPGRVLPPPAVGFTESLSVELDFGAIDSNEPLLLALTGWFRFGNSSTNIAASQRGDLRAIWPRLEALDGAGSWRVVDEMVGFPAGNTKTIVCDLRNKLPQGTKRLRLTTSFEVRWDEIALYRVVPGERARVTELEPASAELHWHGFHDLRAPSVDEPHFPVPGTLTDEPPWQTAVEGWSTRYGDVLPLLVTADAKHAILNSGDAATLAFAATSLPSKEGGFQRTLLLYTVGWIKAGDPNSLPGLSVAPFPGSDLPADPDGDWQRKYNTRWVPRDRFVPRSRTARDRLIWPSQRN